MECLEVVWALILLRPYLEGGGISVRTDHLSLKWILNLVECTRRLSHYRYSLIEFSFIVVKRAGTVQKSADAFSRLSNGTLDYTEIKVYSPTLSEEDRPPSEFIVCFECEDPKIGENYIHILTVDVYAEAETFGTTA